MCFTEGSIRSWEQHLGNLAMEKDCVTKAKANVPHIGGSISNRYSCEKDWVIAHWINMLYVLIGDHRLEFLLSKSWCS